MKYISDSLYRNITLGIKTPERILRSIRAFVARKQDYLKNQHYISKSRQRASKDVVELLTVAFNSVQTIEMQWYYLKKNIRDKFNYTVVDNSTNKEMSDHIYNFCKNNEITYLKFEGNPYNGKDPSMSHGLTINWSYNKYIKNRSSAYFGIIDHDIFPLKPTSIIMRLRDKPFYGFPQSRGSKWYLWPGYSFFSLPFLKSHHPNFAPIWGTDTGGGNWPGIYKKFKESEFPEPKHEYIALGKDEKSKVEKIDDWVHLMAVSGWRDNGKVKDVKEIMKLIDKHYKKTNK